MKHGPEHAKRLKRLFSEMTRKFGKPAPAAESDDPVEQLVIGILSACSTRARAETVFKKLREQVVDLNELRVTPPVELADMIGNTVPLAREKAHRIVEALNAIRRRQDSLDITFLKQRGRREAREYLESLEGVDKAAAAHVVLYSLGGHAVPVDDLTLYVLQKEDIVEPKCESLEAQSFLERQIAASDARLFTDLLSRYVAAKGARVAVESLPGLLRPPPPPPPPPPAPPAKPASGDLKDSKKATAPADAKKAAPAAGNSKKPEKKLAAVANTKGLSSKAAPVRVAAKKPAAKHAEHKAGHGPASHNGSHHSKAAVNRKKK